MDNIENYKVINAEMSKTIATFKREFTRLKEEVKKLTIDLLHAQNQIIRLKRQIADSQKFQVEHVNALTLELQSFVCKMNEVVVSNNERNPIAEQSTPNVSANVSEGSRRMSRSYESPVQRRRSASRNDDEESVPGLHTITEENDETDTTRNTTPQSIITSQLQSTITNLDSIKNSLLDPDTSTSIQSDVISVINSYSIASNSIKSNKENQSSTSSQEPKQIGHFGDLSPLKNVDFVTNRRGKHKVINHSNEGMSGVVSSTPYKRIVNETNTRHSISTPSSESDASKTETERTYVSKTRSKMIRNTTKSLSTLSNDSGTIPIETEEVEIVPSKRAKNTGKIFSNLSNGCRALEPEAMPIEFSNTRPKRKACQATSFAEPKLNTKLRQPLTKEPKTSAKPKRN